MPPPRTPRSLCHQQPSIVEPHAAITPPPRASAHHPRFLPCLLQSEGAPSWTVSVSVAACQIPPRHCSWALLAAARARGLSHHHPSPSPPPTSRAAGNTVGLRVFGRGIASSASSRPLHPLLCTLAPRGRHSPLSSSVIGRRDISSDLDLLRYLGASGDLSTRFRVAWARGTGRTQFSPARPRPSSELVLTIWCSYVRRDALVPRTNCLVSTH